MNSNQSSNCSSRSSSIAPQEFNIDHNLVESHFGSDSTEDNSLIINALKPLIAENGRKSSNINNNNKRYLLECRVCRCDRSVFFCSDCVRNGDFTYSKQRFPERFAEKKLKYFKLKCDQKIISDKIETQLQNNVIKDQMEFKIRLIESNVDELTKSLLKSKQRLDLSEKSLVKTKVNQNECKERQNKLKSKLIEAKQYLNRRQTDINKLMDCRDKNDSYIKQLVQQRVQQLTAYIFPIEAKEGVNEYNEYNSMFGSETTPLLEPISDSNHLLNINYSVVEPWISGNGDYNAFPLFASNERDFPNRDSGYRNAKYRTCAALAYLTQLMNIIAFYLDIRLPKRLSYSEFFANDLTETQFKQKVAKLNANVIYLCLSQNIDSDLLNPRQTVKNLLRLLNSSVCLGIRNHPIVIRTDYLETIECFLSEDLFSIDETDIEDNTDPNDENLIVEYDWVENNLPDLQLNMSSQQTSIATGFMSTVSSIWRAYYRPK